MVASIGNVIYYSDGTWSWSYSPLDGPDAKTVTLTATDNVGAMTVATFDLIVNNVAADVGRIITLAAPVNVNDQPIDFTIVFTDPGVLDSHTAVWAWGDGSATPGTVTETGGSGSVSDSHTYAGPGVYAVSLTVIDNDGDSGSSPLKYVVVYDPDAGYVTGSGWFDSPPGAYVPDPMLTGYAIFGFVSNYRPGASTPNGRTKFLFQTADLSFQSDSYDWLVIAGHKAMYKGVGTINGVGTYGFLLSAIDAALTPSVDVDRFRIKIWDTADGDTVVYDNQVGDADDADPTTAIGGGSIVIEKAKQTVK
jgi:PKD repeat protein